jgi:hypothetical protein
MRVGRVAAGAAAIKTSSGNDLLKLLSGGVYNARIASSVLPGIKIVPTAHDSERINYEDSETHYAL